MFNINLISVQKNGIAVLIWPINVRGKEEGERLKAKA
jgi:hypothetical protein